MGIPRRRRRKREIKAENITSAQIANDAITGKRIRGSGWYEKGKEKLLSGQIKFELPGYDANYAIWDSVTAEQAEFQSVWNERAYHGNTYVDHGHYDTAPYPTYVWNEGTTHEAYIATPEPNFYNMLATYDMLGYYPDGHWKARGEGTWLDVFSFAIRLGLAATVETLRPRRSTCSTRSLGSRSTPPSSGSSMNYQWMAASLGARKRSSRG